MQVYIEIKKGVNLMIHVLTKCPVCTHQLTAVKLTCQSCGTNIENTFDFPKLMTLSKEQQEFVEVFIRSRGNIKDVEKALGISYPTVRAKLDQVIESLGEPTNIKVNLIQQATQTTYVDKQPVVDDEKKNEILDLLEKGEITADEALLRLKR